MIIHLRLRKCPKTSSLNYPDSNVFLAIQKSEVKKILEEQLSKKSDNELRFETALLTDHIILIQKYLDDKSNELNRDESLLLNSAIMLADFFKYIYKTEFSRRKFSNNNSEQPGGRRRKSKRKTRKHKRKTRKHKKQTRKHKKQSRKRI
jgi:hypothetical protein